jgi:hypothetical protein
MMKKTASLAFAAMMIIASAALAETPPRPEEFTSVDELALAIAAYFPKVQGAVQEVQGDKVVIGLGKKDGIMPNMVLSVWRDGKEILHPVTKAVIGRAEDEVGTLEVTEVTETKSTAVMKKRVLEPRAGDRARITPRKISIAIVPLRDDKPDLIQTLGERLNELGRFSVLEQQKVTAFLKDRKQRDATLVRDLGSAFVLDAAVTVSILPADGKYLTTSRIFYADEAKPLDSIVATLDLTTKRDALGDVRPFFAPVQASPRSEERMPDLPLNARYFSVADLNGDGSLEYVFSDTRRLSVYRLEPAGWKQVWVESVPGGEGDMQQFSLSTADINGNGKPEIFITRMLSGTVSSYVLEFSEGSYRRIADLPGFLQVLSDPGRGAVLIGQDYDPEKFYAGQPRELAWTDRGYSRGREFSLPQGVTLYSFIAGSFSETRPLLAAIDRENRIVMYAGETAIWKSEEKYYPVDSTLIRPLAGFDAALGRTPDSVDYSFNTAAAQAEQGRKEKVPGRIVAFDIDGNGMDEVIVPRNTPKEFVGGFGAGTLEGLGWTGTRLEPRWNRKDLPGPVLDVRVVQQNGVASLYVLEQTLGGMFKKDTFRLERFGGK